MSSVNQPKGDAVSRFIRRLRREGRVPINFIQADERIENMSVAVTDDIRAVLDALVSQAPIYRWSVLNRRYVLYPRTKIWDARIDQVHVSNTPRLSAAAEFVKRARIMVAELADLAEPPLIGDPRAQIFTEPISLATEGSILQHLVALLGDDSGAVFTIEPTAFGDRVLHFDR